MNIPEGYKVEYKSNKRGTIIIIVMIAIISILFLLTDMAHAADTGWLSADSYSTQACESGTVWTNPSNAASSDNNQAQSSVGLLKPNGQCLRGDSFTTGIPTGSTINGIEVQFERARASTGSGTVSDKHIEILKNGSVTENKALTSSPWGTTDTTITYGNSTDTWSASWSTTDTIGVQAGAKWAGTTGSRTITADMLQIKIYYTEPTVSETPIKSYWLRALFPIAFASTTCSFVTDTTLNGHHTTTTAECSDPVATTTPIVNTSQDFFNGILIALGIASIMSFFVLKIKERG